MICEGVPKCCVLSPGLGNIVVAGTEEGSLVVWDLSESANLHYSEDAVTLNIHGGVRRPTYTTDALTFRDDNHLGQGNNNSSGRSNSNTSLEGNQHRTPVVAVQLIQDGSGSSGGGSNMGGGNETNALSFQLATLEESGVVMLWTVLKLKHGDPAGSETDLGLGIGGRVKLVRSTKINLLNSVAEEVTTMSFSVDDPSRFFVGTLSGRLLHQSRFSTILSPREYEASNHSLSSSICCMATNKHPAMGKYMLIGRANGSISMYHTDEAIPLAVWDDTSTGAGNDSSIGSDESNRRSGATKWSSVPRSIVKIVWSAWRPSLFWVLDSGGRLYEWNLLVNPFGPTKEIEQTLTTRQRSGELSPLVDVVLCGDRSRGSLISLYLNGEMAVQQLSGGDMRGMKEEDIGNLKTKIGELCLFV